jgi:hypothetical protein
MNAKSIFKTAFDENMLSHRNIRSYIKIKQKKEGFAGDITIVVRVQPDPQHTKIHGERNFRVCIIGFEHIWANLGSTQIRYFVY